MNQTLDQLLNRRSIRAFKPTAIPAEHLNLILEAARHSASSSFGQTATLISITDESKKQAIATICKQAYVAQAAHLIIIVMDYYRNATIASEANQDISVIGSTDRFLASAMDAGIMATTLETAAGSLGIGSVYLGSIQNDAQAMIDLLDLPPYTFPILGIALGYADQEPHIKPKLPLNLMHGENSYPRFANYHEAMHDYDHIVNQYYDLRNANTRVDSFTLQMTKRMNAKDAKRLNNLKVLNDQGLLKY